MRVILNLTANAAPDGEAVDSSPKNVFCVSRTAFLALGIAASFCATSALAANSEAKNEPARAEASAPAAEPSTIERIEQNIRELSARASEAMIAVTDITGAALSLIGVNYKFGGNSPETGLDCSGFVRYVFQTASGIVLPRSAREQSRVGKVIEKSELEPGDLVFFNTRRAQFSHVGVYLGENRFIHAPRRGGEVEIVDITDRYWQRAFNGARRIVGVVASDPPAATQ